MPEPEAGRKKRLREEEKREFSEVQELGHERNPVAEAQKQMASQETAGVWDEQ
ncbi:hypothetical protein LJK88_47380 [Paenibacillus sp. P26]|nr:hypothetical protein LJK88_47380 [Paenibacillus sp. P26]UUZ91809.1 hypothetical protein LJK87_40955 [Paenibacillus sp. P25]